MSLDESTTKRGSTIKELKNLQDRNTLQEFSSPYLDSRPSDNASQRDSLIPHMESNYQARLTDIDITTI